jgi:predicted acyl esterase
MVPLRDGVRIAVDVHRPTAEGQRFPAILAWGMWGKDALSCVGKRSVRISPLALSIINPIAFHGLLRYN